MADSWLILYMQTQPVRKMRRACRAEGRVEQRDCGVIRFQASVGASYYGAHFIRIHFQLSDVLNTLSEEHNPVK